jgi:hypothetical protein
MPQDLLLAELIAEVRDLRARVDAWRAARMRIQAVCPWTLLMIANALLSWRWSNRTPCRRTGPIS